MSKNIYTKKLQKLWNKDKVYKTHLKEFDYSNLNPKIKKARQILWHLLNDIKDIPKCKNKNCYNEVKWFKREYFYFCSTKCSANSKEKQEKIKQTNLKTFGVENPFQSEKIRKKQKNTCLEKYGVEFPQKLEDIKNKTKQTKFKKYGNKNFYNEKKHKESNINKYGVENSQQKHYSKETKEILFSEEKFNKFMKNKTTKLASNILFIDQTTIQRYIKKYNTQYLKHKSSFELEMEEFLKENNIPFHQNTRQQISPYELDFYIPTHDLAIECNGDYWHSLYPEGYHMNKHNLCKEKGIRLIHLWEILWNENRDEMKEFILENLE